MVVGEEKMVGEEWINSSWPRGRAGYPRVEGQASSMNTRLIRRRIDNEM